MRFGFTPHFYAMSAAEVLSAGVGYSNTKATLFIALLRAAGIEARQQFVDVNAAVLRGMFDLRTPFIDHSYTEVLLDGAWVPTDSYVVDRRAVPRCAGGTARRGASPGLRCACRGPV